MTHIAESFNKYHIEYVVIIFRLLKISYAKLSHS